jgi:hypothetical protein
LVAKQPDPRDADTRAEPAHAFRVQFVQDLARTGEAHTASLRTKRHAIRHAKRHVTAKKRHAARPLEKSVLPSRASARHNQGMGRKDKGREICINCGQTFHKKLTSKELRCTKCRKAEKKAA